MCPKALERLTHRFATAKKDPEKMEPTTKLVIGIDIGGTKALTGLLAGTKRTKTRPEISSPNPK